VTAERHGVSVLHDATGAMAATYGGGAWLIRPDGYVGWRGPSVAHPGLRAYAASVTGVGA
jgi:hypothetical protein